MLFKRIDGFDGAEVCWGCRLLLFVEDEKKEENNPPAEEVVDRRIEVERNNIIIIVDRRRRRRMEVMMVNVLEFKRNKIGKLFLFSRFFLENATTLINDKNIIIVEDFPFEFFILSYQTTISYAFFRTK